MDSNRMLTKNNNSNNNNNNYSSTNKGGKGSGVIMSNNIMNSSSSSVVGTLNQKSPITMQDISNNTSEKRPSITAEELTPIVLNQLQTATKLRGDGSRKFRRGSSRSSQSSTPQKQSQSPGHRSGSAGAANTAPTTPRSASAASNGVAYDNATAMSGGREHGKGGNGLAPGQVTISQSQNNCHFESESESSCGEESRLRTAEAFMSGIQSALIEKEHSATSPKDSAVAGTSESGAGLSKELVGEVDSVLSKLMSQLKQGDPSLIPLITNLQTSLKTAANSPSIMDGSNKNKIAQLDKNKQLPSQTQPSVITQIKKQSPVVSELFGNECTYLSNIGTDSGGGGGEQPVSGSKIPWKIRAARKRALKHHTTGMTKDEFAQIKQSLTQAATTLPPKPTHNYPLARNKSEGTILSHASQMQDTEDYPPTHSIAVSGIDPSMPSTYQMVEGNRAYGAVMNTGRGCNMKGNVATTASNTDCDGYSSDVCDYNVEMKSNEPPNSVSSGKQKPSSVISADGNVINTNRFEADNSYVKPDHRDRPVSMVSPWALKPMSPKMESSLFDRRQKLIQKRANVFRNTIPSNNTQNITSYNYNNKHYNMGGKELGSGQNTDHGDKTLKDQLENIDTLSNCSAKVDTPSPRPHPTILGHTNSEDEGLNAFRVVSRNLTRNEYSNKQQHTLCEQPALTAPHSMSVPSSMSSCYSMSSSKTDQNQHKNPISDQPRTSSCEMKSNDSCVYSSKDNVVSIRYDSNDLSPSSLLFPLQADSASIETSQQKMILSTDSEQPNMLSSDSELGGKGRERNKLAHQSSVDEISIDGPNNSRALRRSHSKSSTSGVQAKIARRKMMRQANAIDAPPPHLCSDQEINTNDEDDSVEEKQDSEPIFDAHSKKSLITSPQHDLKNQVDGRFSNKSTLQNNGEVHLQQTPPSVPKGTHELTPEMGKNTNWTSRFSNIKNSFASEEDLSKSRSPSINRSNPPTDEEQPKDRGRSKNKSASPKSPKEPIIDNTNIAADLSTNDQKRISQLKERPPSKEDKNKLNTITASGNSNNVNNDNYNNGNNINISIGATPLKTTNAYHSDTIETKPPAQPNLLSPRPQPKHQTGVKKHSAPASLTVNQQAQQQLPKSKQPTPNREPTLSSGRVSKSLPREGRSYNDQSRAEVLGFVRSDREEITAAGGTSHSKNSDMDYQEYMSIINRVRRTKEFSRVRSEQYKLASMYAKEKKRQEELKLEEERLQRERIKIEAEQKTLQEQQDNQQQQRSQMLEPTSSHIQPTPSLPVNNSLSRQQQVSAYANSSHCIPDDNRNSQLNDVEKGQLDNDESEQNKVSPSPRTSPPAHHMVDNNRSSTNTNASTAENNSTPFESKTPNSENIDQDRRRSTTGDGSDHYHQEQLRLHNLRQEQAKQEQMRLEQIQQEQKRQQELRENQVRAEQEKLEKLREEQERQQKEREEIRRLEFERLQQIQEDQLRLEEERHRQQEQIRLEQMRLEEERKRQERIQAEKNALYNRQRLDMEAQNIAMNEEDRVMRDRQKQKMFTPQNEIESLSPQEKIIQERLLQQDKLRQEHRKEEAQIRQEKLNLIQQEETLITKQEEMLRQIETERENLRTQEDKIRSQQQDRLQNVRQEKLLLEKQEEMLFMRKEQLMHERIRQEKLRDEQRLLREQEEAIKKRQEQICKELMGEIVDENVNNEPSIVNNQLLANTSMTYPSNIKTNSRVDTHGEPESDTHRPLPTKAVLSQEEYGFGNTTNTSTDATRTDNEPHTTTSTAVFSPHTASNSQTNSLSAEQQSNLENVENTDVMNEVDDDDVVWSGSGSGSEDDTLDEDGYYESKVEVKQSHTSVPTTVRTIETTIDNPPWAPITPYLTYSEKQNVQTQEEVSAIFSQAKTKPHYPGVVTSPESLRTSTNLITTPESSVSLHSQISHTPLSQTSSGHGSPPPPIPPLPKDDIHPNEENFHPLQPEVPPRDDSFKVTAVYTSGSENAVYGTAGIVEKPKQNLLEVPSQDFVNEGSASPQSPRIGGPGSAFKPYASNENLFEPSNFATRKHSDEGNKSELSSDPHQNYPLPNGNTTKFTDSRYFMRNQNGKEEFKPPMHGKIRDLRKATVKPFSTTDTEPEMRECNLNTHKKGKQKVAVYSTSETEEEYQAYLRSKPKWHGKGGHKDSWDPLLIQSPPQITQRPVGIIQRPKAQNAPITTVPPVIERGVQIDYNSQMYGNFYANPVTAYNQSLSHPDTEALIHEQYMISNENGQYPSDSSNLQQSQEVNIKKNIELQKEQHEAKLREQEAEKRRKEIRDQEIKEQQQKEKIENEKKIKEELALKAQEKKDQEEKERIRLDNEKRLREEIARKKEMEEKLAEEKRLKEVQQKQMEEQIRLEAQKEEAASLKDKTPTNQRKLVNLDKVEVDTGKKDVVKQGTDNVTMTDMTKPLEQPPTNIPIKKVGPLQQLASFERIQKSDSIIELREKQEASKATGEQVSKSRSVRDLSKAFLDQSQNIIPQSVAEINRNSFLSPNDHSDNAKEPSPISPNLPRSNIASLKSPQYDSTSSNGLENDENLSEGLHSPVISRYSSSPRIQMSPKPSQGSDGNINQTNSSSDSTRQGRSRFSKTDQQKPSPRHQSNPRKEMHDKLMNEALLQVELKKEKAKPKLPITRMNPTIAAMEIMTRKEIKMGEMERRIARGELPQIPVPATPVHMKDQQSVSQNHASTLEHYKQHSLGSQSPPNAARYTPTSIKQHPRSHNLPPGQGDHNGFHQIVPSLSSISNISLRLSVVILLQTYGHLVTLLKASELGSKSSSESIPPVIILKKQPKRLDPSEIKARKTSTEKSAGSQDEKSISNDKKSSKVNNNASNENKAKPTQQDKSSTQQPQITNKVAQAISAVKAKVIPPKEKPKGDCSGSSSKKNSLTSTTTAIPSDTPFTAEKAKTNVLVAGSKSAGMMDVKRIEEKTKLEGQKSKSSLIEEKVLPSGKMSSAQLISNQPLQPNNQPNRLVAEVKPMQNTQSSPNIQNSTENIRSVKQQIEDEEVRNETVKKAAERFEKETLKANNRGRGSGAFGAYRERSKSIGHALTKRISTDVEDADYDEDSVTTSSSMLPWANDNNNAKSSTPAIVRKRNSMRGVGSYQLQMSKSSDSITAAKMLAEARMKGMSGDENQPEMTNSAKGRQNYHQKKALRINAQNYGGVGGRGEMSKSIEKQIDVYTKTREDIRRILDVAKKLSVAERVKLLDNQQIDLDSISSTETKGNVVENVSNAQSSAGFKSRDEKAEAIRREILEAKALAKRQAEEEESLSVQGEKSAGIEGTDIKILSPVAAKVKPLKIAMKPKTIAVEDGTPQAEKSRGVPGSSLRINQSPGTNSGDSGTNRVGRSSERRCVNFDNVVKRSKSCGGDDKELRRTSLDMENIASVKSRIETYLTSAAQVAPTIVEQPTTKPALPSTNVKQPKSILINRSEGGGAGKIMKIPKLIHNGEGESKNLKIYAQSATDISAGEEDHNSSNRENNRLRFSNQQEKFLNVPKEREEGMLLGGVRKSKSFATPGQFECAMDDRQIDEKRQTMMAFFTSQTQVTQPIPLHQLPQSTLKSERKISQPAMHIHTTGGVRGGRHGNEPLLRNPETSNRTNNKSIKRSSVTSISDEILGDEDLRDVDAVFESLLTSTFSENESSSSISASKPVTKVAKKDKQVRSDSRKAELGKDPNMGGGKIGNSREEKNNMAMGGIDVTSNTLSQTSNSKTSIATNKKISSVTRKPSRSKVVAGEVKLSALPASVQEHVQGASIRSEQEKIHLQQSLSVIGKCDEREKVSTTRKLKSDRKSSSENQEGLKAKSSPDMYKKTGGNIPIDPIGSLPTSHTKKYLPRQQTWAGPQGSTPPPPISPSPTQSEYESCDPWDDY